MELKEGRLQSLVLTCLTLVSLFVTSTRASHLPVHHASNNVGPADTKPTTATFLMECEAPAGAGPNTQVHNLCWLDEDTLVLVQNDGRQVLKAKVDTQSKTCTYTVEDSGYAAARVSCSANGDIYVTDRTHDYIAVYGSDGLKAIWEPEGIVETPLTAALNKDRIAVGVHGIGPVYVYNSTREFLYKVNINENKYPLANTDLTSAGIYMGVTSKSGNRLIIHDLNDNSTVVVGDQGEFSKPTGVCTAWDHVLVGDSYHHRIAVYTSGGQFVHDLKFKGDIMSYPKNIDFVGGKNLLAVNIEVVGKNKVKIFSLSA